MPTVWGSPTVTSVRMGGAGGWWFLLCYFQKTFWQLKLYFQSFQCLGILGIQIATLASGLLVLRKQKVTLCCKMVDFGCKGLMTLDITACPETLNIFLKCIYSVLIGKLLGTIALSLWAVGSGQWAVGGRGGMSSYCNESKHSSLLFLFTKPVPV